MLHAVIANLINTGWALLIFLGAYLANTIFSLWYNIKVLQESFSWDKLREGLVKCGVFLVGLTLLCVSITTLPLYAAQVGWGVPQEFTDLFADLVIIGAFLLTACRYIKKAFERFIMILNKEGEPTEALKNLDNNRGGE